MLTEEEAKQKVQGQDQETSTRRMGKSEGFRTLIVSFPELYLLVNPEVYLGTAIVFSFFWKALFCSLAEFTYLVNLEESPRNRRDLDTSERTVFNYIGCGSLVHIKPRLCGILRKSHIWFNGN